MDSYQEEIIPLEILDYWYGLDADYNSIVEDSIADTIVEEQKALLR